MNVVAVAIALLRLKAMDMIVSTVLDFGEKALIAGNTPSFCLNGAGFDPLSFGGS